MNLPKHKIVAVQLVDHLLDNGLIDKFQSAYREGHSAETALLRVQNDVPMELDKGNVVNLSDIHNTGFS